MLKGREVAELRMMRVQSVMAATVGDPSAIAQKIEETKTAIAERLQILKETDRAVTLPEPVPGYPGLRLIGSNVYGNSWRLAIHDRGFSNRAENITLFVMNGLTIPSDGRLWQHVSVSRSDGKMPTWNQMCIVKELWFGDDREASQYHPPAEEHISHHPTCLHLLGCLEQRIMPDFRILGTI
jgi:hypothetical protein